MEFLAREHKATIITGLVSGLVFGLLFALIVYKTAYPEYRMLQTITFGLIVFGLCGVIGALVHQRLTDPEIRAQYLEHRRQNPL